MATAEFSFIILRYALGYYKDLPNFVFEKLPVAKFWTISAPKKKKKKKKNDGIDCNTLTDK